MRPTHAELDDIIKKVDDIYWRSYYPPNGWNCRCDVRHLISGTESSKEFTGDGVDSMFATNYAQEGKAFPSYHPYNKNVPRLSLLSLIHFTLQDADVVLKKTYDNGGKLLISKSLKDTASDYLDLRKIATLHAKDGCIAKMNARVSSGDT